MSRSDELLPVVREILFREWDPIGVNGNPLCTDEYDRYAPTIVHMLLAGVDAYKLAAHLAQLQGSGCVRSWPRADGARR